MDYVICLVLCSVCWQQRCLVILKLAIFFSQTESTRKHFFFKKSTALKAKKYIVAFDCTHIIYIYCNCILKNITECPLPKPKRNVVVEKYHVTTESDE
jgi:hypothetical protein